MYFYFNFFTWIFKLRICYLQLHWLNRHICFVKPDVANPKIEFPHNRTTKIKHCKNGKYCPLSLYIGGHYLCYDCWCHMSRNIINFHKRSHITRVTTFLLSLIKCQVKYQLRHTKFKIPKKKSKSFFVSSSDDWHAM